MQRRIEALLDEADAAVTASNWTEVGEKARAALVIDATNADAMTFLGMAEANHAAAALPSSSVVEEAAQPRQAAQVQVPASFASGRYKVLRLLGQGGRKKVYLARDERLGREVAFAVVSGESLSAADREWFLREAQAMARLGSSPHLVSIFKEPSPRSASSWTPSVAAAQVEGAGQEGGGGLQCVLTQASFGELDHVLIT